MANYIAHHTKKKRILAYRESQLFHALYKDEPSEKVEKFATLVREAQVRVLNVRLSLLPHAEDRVDKEERQRILEKYEYWESIKTEEVIALYQKKLRNFSF